MSVDKKHVWHGQQEKILKEWSEISSSYRFMHDRAHGKYHSQNLSFTLPVIILSTITGTANFAHGPAMSLAETEQAVMLGFQEASKLFQDGVEIVGTGDMGIGNTTPSAAIGAVICGTDLAEMVGRGTGVDNEGLARKQAVIRRGIEVNNPNPEDGLDVLSKLGGFEIGGIAGCVLAGAYHRRPVMIDGFISTAGALIAHAICPTVAQYLLAGHCSEEPFILNGTAMHPAVAIPLTAIVAFAASLMVCRILRGTPGVRILVP